MIQCIPVSRRSPMAICISDMPRAFFLNSGLAREYGGKFNLRFDDTNPTKEKQEFVESIKEDVKWLGADWEDRLFFCLQLF